MQGPLFGSRIWRSLTALLLGVALFVAPAQTRAAPGAQTATGTYTNPLPIAIPGGGQVENCPDPSIIHSHTPGDTAWYVYCTTDALNEQDHTSSGWLYHKIPELKSEDLVHWVYVGDAFTSPPIWASRNAGLWAPDIHYFNGQYYLYYTVTDTPSSPTNNNGGGSAVGVATAPTPTGTWTPSLTISLISWDACRPWAIWRSTAGSPSAPLHRPRPLTTCPYRWMLLFHP